MVLTCANNSKQLAAYIALDCEPQPACSARLAAVVDENPVYILHIMFLLSSVSKVWDSHNMCVTSSPGTGRIPFSRPYEFSLSFTSEYSAIVAS